MLEFFRSNVGGFFGLIIIGLLAFAFAFSFGAQSKGWGEGQAEKYAANIDGEDISDRTHMYAFNLMGGRGLGQDDPAWGNLQRSVLNGLVERQLLLNLAGEIGLSASIDEAEKRIVKNEIYLTRSLDSLAREIESNSFVDPAVMSRVLVRDGHRVRQSFFNSEGKFDLETYEKFVRYHIQVTEENFVEQQRLELIAERMRQLLVSPVRVFVDEVRSAYNSEHDTAKIEYIRLIPTYFADRLDPSALELSNWAESHKDEIKQYYETNKFRYTNLEKMARARHVLTKVAEDATDEEKAAARKQIEGLLARARAGEDFAQLAKEHSDDAASAVKGGDLGFTPRGRMVPEFDEAMFNAEPGKVTDVVETKYGFHIIKVGEFREGNISLEEATSEIAEDLFRRAKGKEDAQAKSQEFLTRLKAGEEMASLVPKEEGKVQAPLSLKVLSSRSFSHLDKSIPGIGEAPEMIQAAFKADLDNSVLDKVFDVRADYFVTRLIERNRPNDEEFEKLKDGLTESLLAIKQGSWLRDRMNELKSKAEEEGKIKISYTASAAATERTKRDSQPSGDAPSGPKGKEKEKEKEKSRKETKKKEVPKEAKVKKNKKSKTGSGPRDDESQVE